MWREANLKVKQLIHFATKNLLNGSKISESVSQPVKRGLWDGWVVVRMPGGREAAVTCLWVVTPLTASLSLVIVTVAVTTNHWLITEESMLNPHYNGTGDRDYLPKHTISGLFILCYNNREYCSRTAFSLVAFLILSPKTILIKFTI